MSYTQSFYVLEETGQKPRIFADVKKAKEVALEIRKRYDLIDPIEHNGFFYYGDNHYVSIYKTQVE